MQEGRREHERIESESESEKKKVNVKKKFPNAEFDRIVVSIPFLEARNQ